MCHLFCSYLKRIRGLLLTGLIFAVVAVLAVLTLSSTNNTLSAEQSDLLEQSLYSAAVNYYAINGRYPTLEEIELEYGIVTTSDYYNVRYSIFASNIIPDIRVIPVEETDYR